MLKVKHHLVAVDIGARRRLLKGQIYFLKQPEGEKKCKRYRNL
jgi:hypothetical protein